MTDTQIDRIKKLLENYNSNLKPMIVVLESEDSEYPVEVLNEIRAILNHLSRIAVLDSADSDEEKIDLQIHDAEGHLKRALFDCFKYSCISIDDKYRRFRKETRNVDLGVIDNGEFPIELGKKYTKAKNSLTHARLVENDPTMNDSEAVYERFQKAYVEYTALSNYIDDSIAKVERAKHKQTAQQLISYGIGIVGIVFGVIQLLF